MMKRCCALLALVTLCAGTAAAQDAAQVLSAASAAMGTATVKSIQFSGTGWNSAMGQSFMPSEDWPKFELTSYTRVLEYETRGSREEWTRVQGKFPPRGGGGIPVYDWAGAVNGVWTQKFYALGEYGWNIDGTTVSGAPRLSTSAAGMLPSIRQLDIWLSAHGFLKAAAAAKDATAMSLVLEGKAKTIVTFTAMDKYRVNGTIGADNMVERVQTWVQNPVFGDMVFEYHFSNYKDFGGVKFPMVIDVYQGDARINPGHSFAHYDVTSVAVNPSLPPLVVPDSVKNARPAAARVTSSQLSPGVWRIAGEGHHSIAVDFRDFITVVEAPQDEQRSLAVLAEVRKLIPNKPIRYVVNTHHHFDHSGGLRTYVAEGATVVTHAANKDFYQNVFFYPAPRTIEPDLLSTRYPYARTDRAASIEPVSDKYVITDGTRTLDVYALKNLNESDMLVVYLPAEKILINADLYSPPAATAIGPLPKNDDAVRQLNENIKRLKLAVDKHVGIHGDVGPNETFLKVIASPPSVH